MQVEDRLACAGADVDDDFVVLEAHEAGGFGDEEEHPARLIRRELADVAERLDVALRDHEDVRVSLRIDVADRDELVRRVYVVAVGEERAEEAVVRQRGSPPR